MGNGGSINIWVDRWVKEFSSLEEYRMPSLVYVSHLISAFSDNRNANLINSIFPPEVSIVIRRIELCSPLGLDSLLWHFSKNREYSVKSGMKMLQESTLVVKSLFPSSSFTTSRHLWRIIGML